MAMAAEQTGASDKGEVIYRHAGAVRITHWINALVLLVLLMSGLQIFNAHPALYIGSKSDFDHPILAMRPMMHDDKIYGVTTLFGWQFDTTGVFGLSRRRRKRLRGPRLSVVGDAARLSETCRWAGAGTFFFAWLFLFNGLAYLLWSLGSGHLRRDLAPTGQELKHIGASIWDHVRLRFPKGEEAKRYNVLQKLCYLLVALVLLPLMLLTGLAMSPGMDAAFPILLDIFGGRQIGAHHPFHLGEPDRDLLRGAPRHGADIGRLEQSPLDDHRALRDRAGGGKAMSGERRLDRRGFLGRGLAAASATMLGGCDPLSEQPWVRRILDSAETLTRVTQRALLSPADLAREYQRGRSFDASSRPTARPIPTMPTTRPTPPAASPIGSFRSAGWSASRWRFRSTSFAPCRRAPRSPVTIASRAGAASANGRACS